MSVVMLYRSNSERERKSLEFVENYKRRTGRDINLVDVNTVEGSNMANLYDILDYPAIIALTSDGAVQQVWAGENMPLIDDVSYFDIQED